MTSSLAARPGPPAQPGLPEGATAQGRARVDCFT